MAVFPKNRTLSDDDIRKLSDGQYTSIARRSGLSKQHVGRVLNGASGCSFSVAARIAAAADVSIDTMYLFIYSKASLNVRRRPTRGDRQATGAVDVRVSL